MESTKTEIIPIPHSPEFYIRHVIYTVVEDVTEKDGQWWVHFEGSRESMAFGTEKPYEKGEKIKITFERVHDAQPRQSPK